jgi:glycosyltransferase involved in cell wall biosynthesis
MPNEAVLYDLSGFLAHPLRTGIQRVTFEVAAHWAGACPLAPARVGPDGGLYLLPPETLSWMAEYFGTAPGDPERARARLEGLATQGRGPLTADEVLAYPAVLNTELLPDWHRVAFYEGLLRAGGAGRVFFLVYDMLPWLHPEWFAPALITINLGYLWLLRRVRHLAFISRQTKVDFLTRVIRGERPTGPVVPLGADGLGTAAPRFTASRRFAVVGTLEPRKNLMCVLDAFEALWASGVEAELVFAGRMGWLQEADRERVLRLARERPQFRWLPDLGDEGVRELIRSCRATLYPSRGEGFGLPPLESLALGVPVAVSAGVPSLAALEPLGQVRLDPPDAGAVAAAVRALLDDDFCRARCEEIRSLRLPRWADLGREVAAWVASPN